MFFAEEAASLLWSCWEGNLALFLGAASLGHLFTGEYFAHLQFSRNSQSSALCECLAHFLCCQEAEHVKDGVDLGRRRTSYIMVSWILFQWKATEEHPCWESGIVFVGAPRSGKSWLANRICNGSVPARVDKVFMLLDCDAP
eukprot:3916295-Amphidinium_carterae.1